MSDTVRWGIISTAKIAETAFIPAVRQTARGHIAAVASRNGERAKQFAAGHDVLLHQVEETMRRCAFANLGDSVELRVTTFGHKVGMIGAAALALDAFFYRQAVS